MKKIHLAMILSLSFLSSCQTNPPQEFQAKQCQPVISFDPYGDIDSVRSFCRCRDYSISRDFIGSTGAITRKPLKECDQVIGYSVRDNTRLVNFLEHVRSEINASETVIAPGEFREAGHAENQN